MRRTTARNLQGKISVSIHAPREGCDSCAAAYRRTRLCFNSRTPGGVRPDEFVTTYVNNEFQFTHPGRGATITFSNLYQVLLFQFTHPGRGATFCAIISIVIIRCFNSRTPGGVRRSAPYQILLSVRFQFTHPGRGATRWSQPRKYQSEFQFTHPGRGATSALCLFVRMRYSFNSRTPGGVRPQGSENRQGHWCVSIHAPREGCDLVVLRSIRAVHRFNSRTPGGVRHDYGYRGSVY